MIRAFCPLKKERLRHNYLTPALLISEEEIPLSLYNIILDILPCPALFPAAKTQLLFVSM
jgi:hypothetical protein